MSEASNKAAGELISELQALRARVADLERQSELERETALETRLFKAAIKNSPITVSAQNLELRYIYVYNPHPGFSEEKMLGKKDTDLFSEKDAGVLVAVKRQVLETGVGIQREVNITVDDENVFYSINIMPNRDEAGNIIGVTCASMNVTARKRTEEALRQSEERFRRLSEHLEELVEKKLAELQQAQSLAALGQMISTVAHDLKHPLQSIQLAVDMIRSAIGEDEEKLEILEGIEYGVGMLDRIVGDLLEYSRPVKLEYSLRSVHDIIEKALDLMSHRLQNLEVHLDIEQGDTQVYLDGKRITRVLMNIISNAADAMAKGGCLTISSNFIGREREGFLKFRISDTGSGIDADGLARIGEPFFTTKTLGTGLGIAICKKILEAHNGSISIESEVDKGTIVEILLPARPPDEAAVLDI